MALREVSTNGIRLLLAAMDRAGISAQPLLAGLPATLDELRAPGRVDWDVWVEIVERLAATLGGPDQLENFMCDAAASSPGLHQFQRVGQLLSSPTALYRLNSQWGVPNQYHNMRSSCETLDAGRLAVTFWLVPGYRGSIAVFAGAVGILRGMPKLIGLPESTIHERKLGEQRATIVLEPPPSRTVLTQLGRIGRRARGLQSMLTQLGEQETELNEKRVTLEQQLEARRRADAALQSSEARWQALAENAPGTILLLAADGRIISASRTFHGVEPSALRDRRLLDIVAEPARPTLASALARVQDESAPSDVEIEVRDQRGSATHYSCRLAAIKQGQGEVCAFLSDVTERRRVEQDLREREAELERAQRLEALGRLAGGVAHDFNNLLTVICGGTDLLLKERWLAAGQREELLEIQRAGERAVSLTRQLLAFSRHQLILPEPLEVEPLVDEARSMLERLMGEDIHLEFRAQGHGLSAKLDRGQFEQVLMNLAVNARDAMPRGGTLTIAVAERRFVANTELSGVSIPPGEYVELSVQDSGFGLAPETAHRIFEPFFSTKPHGGGTGLGLAIVRGIVTQSGGYVGVTSELGRGTSFCLLFPRSSAPREAVAPAVSPRALGGDERILLVEDDPLVRTLVQRILRDRGYVVTVCARGSEALAQAEQSRFDLLLTDVIMPEISGPELARVLTAAAPEMRVLFMSGYTEDEILNRGVIGAGVSLVPKPFTPEALALAVRKRLDDDHGDLQLQSG